MLALQQDGQQGTHKKDRQYRNLYVVSKSAYHWKCSLLRPLVVLSYLQGLNCCRSLDPDMQRAYLCSTGGIREDADALSQQGKVHGVQHGLRSATLSC